MGKGMRIISTDEEIKILTDPYRIRILEEFISQKKPMTVKEVADLMGEVPAKVHYHFKKLLSIDILELDHVEVIHGINAKYYKLVHDAFRLEVNKDDNLGMRALQIQGISKVFMNQFDNFKKDFFLRAESANHKESDFDKDGFVSAGKVYLTESEYEEFEKMILSYISKHNTCDENKKKYSVFVGMVGKD